jgi:hypothetical protein
MEDKIMRDFLEFLIVKREGKADPSHIRTALSLDLSNQELDSFVEDLYDGGLIFKPHRQRRSGKKPEYDLIQVTEKGKEYIST